MRPSALLSECPPKTKPSSMVIANGTMRWISHGSGFRNARRRSLARRTRSILFPEFAPGQLQEHIIQAGALERHVFGPHRQT